MKIAYHFKDIKKYKKPVVSIGVFDGVHLGHRHILNAAIKKAHRIKGTSIVVTFSPHPQKENSIYSLEHRLRIIEELGIDVCLVIKFDKAFSQITAEDFIKDILFAKLHAAFIYVGESFSFGKCAKGSLSTLRQFSKAYNFKLKSFAAVTIKHNKISSTNIRRLIRQGKLKAAGRLLLRPVSIFGKVIRGSSLGTRLGFPTANINPHHEITPPPGIYAARVLLDNKELNGVCYIGTRPTFRTQYSIRPPQSVGGRPPMQCGGRNTQYSKTIEVHIFNFNKDIYGEKIEIQFIKKIRNEKQFSSPLALVKQINKDAYLVKKVISLH